MWFYLRQGNYCIKNVCTTWFKVEQTFLNWELRKILYHKSVSSLRSGHDKINRHSAFDKKGSVSPCADKTVIWRNYKIGICQTGSDNKTDDIQLRLGVVCFCAFKGWKSLIFCSVMHCSKTGISDFIYSFDLIWKRKNCYYSANRLHELKKQSRVKDFCSVAKFFTKTTTTMFFVSKTSKNILSCVLFEHFSWTNCNLFSKLLDKKTWNHYNV